MAELERTRSLRGKPRGVPLHFDVGLLLSLAERLGACRSPLAAALAAGYASSCLACGALRARVGRAKWPAVRFTD
jgi:hypothetical protein